MNHLTKVTLLGYASGMAANVPGCALGPWYLYYHPNLFQAEGLLPEWHTIIKKVSVDKGLKIMPLVIEGVSELGRAVLPFAMKREPYCVIGGDHSAAIGIWSAVAYANRLIGDIGLIWIDAHMDSHTPDTSKSKNIHGMPLAHLLGYGDLGLTTLFDSKPKIKPENLCIIGIRSYEPAECELLERLGVKLFFMKDVALLGIKKVLAMACQHVSKNTCGFGISLDLDGIDPEDAPGVGQRAPDGIAGKELVAALNSVVHHQELLGLEISEFNPLRDEHHKTAKLLVELIHAVYI